jgi:TonB family protein
MIEILLVKSSVLIFAAMVLCAAMRRGSAAFRHLVWLCAFGALLILPAGSLLPPSTVPAAIFPVAIVERPDVAALTPNMSNLSNIGFATWLCGALFLLAKLIVDYMRGLRLLENSHPVDSNGRYGVAISEALAGPVAWGIGSRRMLLPDAARSWDSERLRIVLLHESGHLRRHDCWAILIVEIASAVYWCNPLVWFAAAQLRRQQEQAVDDEVINSGIDPTTYADQLLAIAKVARAPKLAAGAFGRSDLAVRIQAILDPRRNRAMLSRSMILASVAGLLAITIPVASMQAERKIYKATDAGVIKPRPIDKPNPKYTDEAKEAKIQGTVKLSAIIDIDGKAHEIKVEEGIDDGLDANAVSAVQMWRFEPARKAGEPVPVSVQIEINFTLSR